MRATRPSWPRPMWLSTRNEILRQVMRPMPSPLAVWTKRALEEDPNSEGQITQHMVISVALHDRDQDRAEATIRLRLDSVLSKLQHTIPGA